MPTQMIKGGTVQDVETALLEEYGRTNVTPQAKTDSSAEWSFRITSKSHGTCAATRTPDGVTVTMSPRTHMVLWIATGIGYLACIAPGIFMTIWIVFTRTVTSGVLSHRFPKMVGAVQRVQSQRTNASASRPL